MKYLLFFIPILFSMNALGQVDLLSKDGSKYHYGEKEYKCKELASIYQQNQPALDLYLSGFDLTKKARKNGFIGLGLALGGAALLASGAESAGRSDPNGYVSFGVFSIIGSYIIATVGLVQRIKGSRKLKKAKNLFNYHMIEVHGYHSDLSLSFRQTSNGIGLVLSY